MVLARRRSAGAGSRAWPRPHQCLRGGGAGHLVGAGRSAGTAGRGSLRGGQPEGYCHRQMVDAVRYLIAGGISWAGDARGLLPPSMA